MKIEKSPPMGSILGFINYRNTKIRRYRNDPPVRVRGHRYFLYLERSNVRKSMGGGNSELFRDMAGGESGS